MAWIIGGLVVAGVVWAGLALAGAAVWGRRTVAIEAALRAGAGGPGPSGDAAGLPAPVARYLARALPGGVPEGRIVTLRQSGRFNMGETADRWVPFAASQVIRTGPPGFLWDARMAMAPGVPVRVHDLYLDGEGRLRATLFGLIPLADMRGGGAMAEGELMRYLAEAPWYPWVLLPGGAVTWEAVDDRAARARITEGGVTAELLFRFGEDDLVASVHAAARGRTVGGQVVPTPWEGHWRNCALRDGVMVPLEGEVAWILPGGPKPYWRGRVEAIRRE